jgi:hypothetical protein
MKSRAEKRSERNKLMSRRGGRRNIPRGRTKAGVKKRLSKEK